MFLNREEAGLKLASRLSLQKDIKLRKDRSIIIAIPRGGVIVGKVISEILGIPLTSLIVKKIGAPQNPELAIGATGANGMVFWDEKLISYLDMSDEEKNQALSEAIRTIKEREKRLGVEPLKQIDLKGKTSIVVDDGVATGATSIAASIMLRNLGSQKIILATPVISRMTKRELSSYFDKIVAVETPFIFQAVGQFYKNFPQVEDEEVRKLLKHEARNPKP
jgi:predicted phosphoribosyltransferase